MGEVGGYERRRENDLEDGCREEDTRREKKKLAGDLETKFGNVRKVRD